MPSSCRWKVHLLICVNPKYSYNFYSLQHDTTLAVLLIALNTWDGKIPPYASALIFELHRRSEGSYFVRLLYKNDSLSNPETEAVPLSIRGNYNHSTVDG